MNNKTFGFKISDFDFTTIALNSNGSFFTEGNILAKVRGALRQNKSIGSHEIQGSGPYLQSLDERHYWALVLLAIPMFTMFGNGLVILAVARKRSLQTAINYMIAGLACADMLVASAVMPFAVYVEFNAGSWHIGELVCDLYGATDVACSTASILLLTVISFDRYRAVTAPIAYAQQARNTKRVLLIMSGVWLVSLATASPMAFGLNEHANRVSHECRFYNPNFSIFSSIISFGIPVIVVLFVYARIVCALNRRATVSRKRLQSRRNRADNSRKATKAVGETSVIPVSPVHTPLEMSRESRDSGHDSVVVEMDALVGQNNLTLPPSTNLGGCKVDETVCVQNGPAKNKASPKSTTGSSGTNQHRRHKTSGHSGALKNAKMSGCSDDYGSEMSDEDLDEVALKRKAIFLFCWVPFFWLNVQNAVCTKLNAKGCTVGFLAFFLSTWLGYMNSFVNPIIYTIFNGEFRRAFGDMLRC